MRLTTSALNHQPEAQHPKSSAIHKLAGRLPHLVARRYTYCNATIPSLSEDKRTHREHCESGASDPKPTSLAPKVTASTILFGKRVGYLSGTTAVASISKSSSGIASFTICTAVEAGGALVSK